ncbi:hypothetical protein PVK06_019563 [Gossypium arboreum]|uniref:CCHC-type domain-containing protein n=1 Tax=Gossypium arboreum TaxID=29729 RepID=A0ABR0PK28_GOSAR|nr:hypothetical protein PVK06_019563 [Gossypium arboreum]
MANSMVIKMLGWNIGFTALQNRLYGFGRPSQPLQLMDIEKGYFLAKFQNVISGTVGLPSHLYKIQILWEIGVMIGNSQARGQHARMALYVNLEKPLTSKILINGYLQKIEYENIPVIFFSCGRYGHNKENCPNVVHTTEPVKETESKVVMSKSMAIGDRNYGPLMLVEWQNRRTNLERNKKSNNFSREKLMGSRFHSLTGSTEASLKERTSMET